MVHQMKHVLPRSRALREGWSAKAMRTRLRSGRWQVLQRGVYLTREGEPTWRERVLGAVLARGKGAVASGEAALALWGLSDREPRFIVVAIPHSRTVEGRLRGARPRRRRRLTRSHRHGIPVTGLHQTVLDVLASPAMSVDDVVSLLVRACAPGRSTPARLLAELEHHPRHPLRRQLRELLEVAEAGLGSAAEWRYLRDVQRAHRLPEMVPQAPVDPGHIHGVGTGGRPREGVERHDLVDAERQVAVEIDGSTFHRGREARDTRRDRRSAGHGRVTVRVLFVELVFSPCDIAVDVALVLRQRGWTGRPIACSPGCPVASDPRLLARPA